MKIYKIIILLSLVSFLSCSTEVDIMDCGSEQLHTCYATFNITELHFCDEVPSRADGSWFNSLTDNMSLRFHNQDGSISLGYATYNKDKEMWEITYKGSITSNEKQKVELFLVRGGSEYKWDDYFRFYETTCFYSDSEGEYIRNSNGEISIQATLKPLTGRIRFKGVPGDTFTLSGLSTSNYYDIKTGQLSENDSPVTLSIGSNGYSPYIYGIFTNITSPTMSITTDDCTFTANCPTSMLNVGKSGWMKLPSRQEHTGWVIEEHDYSINGHEYVDLGLPSGTLWATMNIGASVPEGSGDYYSWGEIEAKSVYNWSTYKWGRGSETTMTKYCVNPDYGIVDNLRVLCPEDDVAHVKWGSNWHIPKYEEMRELLTMCSWNWVKEKKGYNVVGPNGKYIFFPASGYVEIDNVVSSGAYGAYWISSDVLSGSRTGGYYLGLASNSVRIDSHYRYRGHSVRPVCSLFSVNSTYLPFPSSGYHKDVLLTANDSWVATTSASWIAVNRSIGIGNAKVTITVSPNTSGSLRFADIIFQSGNLTQTVRVTQGCAGDSEHEFVDLDLPSGTLWATMNLGSSQIEDNGLYYAWGDTVGYSSPDNQVFCWQNYSLCNKSEFILTKYCDNVNFGKVDNLVELEYQDDAANHAWGDNWRIPTTDQFDELFTECICAWVQINGKNGYKIKSKSSEKYIFLPASGMHLTSSGTKGNYGEYMTSNLGSFYYPGSPAYVFDYLINSKFKGCIGWGDRCYPKSIRPVI